MAPAEKRYNLGGGRLWIVSFAVWTLVALLDMAGSRLFAAVAGTEAADWRVLLTWSLNYAEPLALFTPFIYLGSQRFAPSRSGWMPAVWFHLTGSIVFA